MARNMPPLASQLRTKVREAVDLANMGERLCAHPTIGITVRQELTTYRQYLIYELAYLRAFNQWEIFLESVCLRYLCGYQFMGSTETPVGAFAADLATAKANLYAGNAYLLWHNPQRVITRVNTKFAAGNRLATVIGSALADIENFAAIRHRIAHDHQDARSKFDVACMRLAARRFRGSRPGAFLRIKTLHRGTPVSWLERICDDLCALAAQLAP